MKMDHPSREEAAKDVVSGTNCCYSESLATRKGLYCSSIVTIMIELITEELIIITAMIMMFRRIIVIAVHIYPTYSTQYKRSAICKDSVK